MSVLDEPVRYTVSTDSRLWRDWGLVYIICIGIDTMILSELPVWAVCIYRVAILLEWLMYLLIYDPLTAVDSRSKLKLVVR